MKRILGLTAVLVVAFFISTNTGAKEIKDKPCKLKAAESCFIPASQHFVCSQAKPIDTLKMVWNGEKAIKLKAWKGKVGSTLLEETEVGSGELVEVSGYAGSPPDVIWEIFDSATKVKIGESTFNLSCSDDNMNGPEDCGKPQGNGKKNNPNKVVDWLLAGMAGGTQSFECYPAAAAVAELVRAPGLSSNDPEIYVTGPHVVRYKYRIDDGPYSEEIPISVPIILRADVRINGNSFTSGSSLLQQYIDQRANTEIHADLIKEVEFANVSSDTPVYYLLNSLRVFLENDNVLLLQGDKLDQLNVTLNSMLAQDTSFPGLVSFQVSGGKLKLLGNTDPKTFLLEVPVSKPSISITASAPPASRIKINGIQTTSGLWTQMDVTPGTAILLETIDELGSSEQYLISIGLTEVSPMEIQSYYLRSETPENDFVIIANNGSSTASVTIDLNNRLFADDRDLLTKLESMNAEYEGEPFQRKVWRFIRENRYHFEPITASTFGHAPSLFFNSIGFGFCDDSAALFYQIMTLSGYEARVWSLEGHVVPEVKINGRWEMWDPDLGVYYLTENNQIAGVEELSLNPTLITDPIKPILTIPNHVYSQGIADIYSSTDNNSISAYYYYNPLADYQLQIDIPEKGTIKFPKKFFQPLHAINSRIPPNYSNAKITIPKGWSGILKASLVLHGIGYKGEHKISVLAKDDIGRWQEQPTELTLNIAATSFSNVGSGDFNGDGKIDILWRNTTTGANTVWFMDGTTLLAITDLLALPNPGYAIVGTGDFNNDGKTDILWRNTTSGQNAVWFMNGTTVSGFAVLDSMSDQSWKIVGTGDFNNDGKTDILWRNTTSGQNAVWFMDGTTVSGFAVFDSMADQTGKIVGR